MRVLLCACAGALAVTGCKRPSAPSPQPRSEPSLASVHPKPAPVPSTAPAPREQSRRFAARADGLCFSEGDGVAGAGDLLRIRDPKARAVLPDSDGDSARVSFRYHGPTQVTSALKSGARRRQLGLKLRARDACNLIYVMWRLEPKQELVVSFKNNPDASSSSECGNDGYVTLRAAQRAALPPLEAGSDHALEAEVVGNDLDVRVDGNVVWHGALPTEALALQGPSGFRSDNVEWSLHDFRIVRGAHPFSVRRCRAPLAHSAPTSGTSSGASSASGRPSE
ncbi:MAG: hypothetical protein ACOY0T_20750 [Myxococcota bacterium]